MQHSSDQYATIGKEANEKRDCVIRALSIAACIDYNTAHALLKKHGRKDKRGTPLHVSIAALKELFPDVEMKSANVSLDFFARSHTQGHYLVYTRNHAIALCDGVIHDWSSHPRYRVRYYWKLV